MRKYSSKYPDSSAYPIDEPVCLGLSLPCLSPRPSPPSRSADRSRPCLADTLAGSHGGEIYVGNRVYQALLHVSPYVKDDEGQQTSYKLEHSYSQYSPYMMLARQRPQPMGMAIALALAGSEELRQIDLTVPQRRSGVNWYTTNWNNASDRGRRGAGCSTEPPRTKIMLLEEGEAQGETKRR